MKILCFIHDLNPGGAERVMSLLASAWSGKGHSVTIVTYGINPTPFFPLHTSIKLVNLKLAGGQFHQKINRHLRRIPQFRKAIKTIKPDIIVSFITQTNILALLAAKGLRTPVIVSERVDPQQYQPAFPYNVLRKTVYQNAAALVVQNRRQARWFSDMVCRVKLLENPVNITQASIKPVIKRNHTIVAIGRLTKQKGFDLLLNGFANIQKNIPHWNLIIYGKGEERIELEEQIKHLKLDGRVQIKATTADITAILLRAGCFILPSRFEGMPNVLLEALACGCPVIATNCSDSIGSIINTAKNGLIIPPDSHDNIAKALLKIIGSPELRKRLSKHAPNSIQQFDINTIAIRWENLFQEIINEQNENR